VRRNDAEQKLSRAGPPSAGRDWPEWENNPVERVPSTTPVVPAVDQSFDDESATAEQDELKSGRRRHWEIVATTARSRSSCPSWA
jgi:hypothetical protein